MNKFHNNVLPAAFHSFFTKVTSVHNNIINTRFAANTLTIFLMLEPIMANLISHIFKVHLSGIPCSKFHEFLINIYIFSPVMLKLYSSWVCLLCVLT